MNRIVRLILLSLALAAGTARAMETRSCDDPRAFPNTPVNVLLLPYTYTGADAQLPLSQAARRLGVLLEYDNLLEMVKYETIAVVNLVRLPGAGPCVPEEIWQRMVGPNRDRKAGLRSGGAAAMIWGRIYEQEGELYIQSYLRFGRADRPERIERTIGAARFAAQLPAQVVSTPPRRITRQDLDAVNAEFANVARVHTEPDENARVVDRLPDVGAQLETLRPFGYAVLEARGDWVRVISLHDRPPGWIRARSSAKGWLLRDRLPELHLLDASVAYLQLRVAVESTGFFKPAAAPRLIAYAQQSLARYREAVGAASPPADALGRALLGTMRLVVSGADGEGVAAAESEFAEAVRRVPYNAEARNLHNLARLLRCCAAPARAAAGAKSMQEALLDAVAVDPENRNALGNLAAFHQLLADWPEAASAIGTEEIDRQRAALRRLSGG